MLRLVLRRWATALAVIGLLGAAACGKKGDIEAPPSASAGRVAG